MSHYEEQDDFDDVIVDYAASADDAGCGCLGCAPVLLLLLLLLFVSSVLAVK
jgi:hypothetical protein